MFKILKDVLEEKGERTEAETTARVGGRVRSAEAKKAIAEKLKKGMESLEATPLMDLKTGEIKTKKPKKVPKEKTPEEACLHEAKTMRKKSLGWDYILYEKHWGSHNPYRWHTAQ